MEQKINDELARLKDAIINAPANLAKYAIIAAVIFVILYVVLAVLKKRRKPAEQAPDLGINVAGLSTQGPPPIGPALYYYSVPVRLAALVLAPVGRAQELPPVNRLDDLIDAVMPGLALVVAAHKPVVRRWPGQISSRGFVHTFFSQAKLPGEGGKGTPWCSAAGVFKIGKQPVMAGLVMRATVPTNLGQAIIEQEAQWLDVLRIKR
jgi:hypothetical protein